MKQIKALLLASLCLMLFTACPEDHNEVVPPVYNQSLEIPFSRGSQTYTVSDLKKAIFGDIENTDTTWLIVTKLDYSSGSPRVLLEYKENNGKERSANVTFKDVDNNKVILTVKQARKFDIDDPHDKESDQSAYSRQR